MEATPNEKASNKPKVIVTNHARIRFKQRFGCRKMADNDAIEQIVHAVNIGRPLSTIQHAWLSRKRQVSYGSVVLYCEPIGMCLACCREDGYLIVKTVFDVPSENEIRLEERERRRARKANNNRQDFQEQRT